MELEGLELFLVPSPVRVVLQAEAVVGLVHVASGGVVVDAQIPGIKVIGIRRQLRQILQSMCICASTAIWIKYICIQCIVL